MSNIGHYEKAEKDIRITGKLLIIFGFGIPVMSGVIILLLNTLYPRGDEPYDAAMFAYFIIIIPLWIIPVIGGFFALKRKNHVFTLISCYVSLSYWLVFLLLLYSIINYWSYVTLLFILYLPVFILSIPAFIKVLRSKNVFLRK